MFRKLPDNKTINKIFSFIVFLKFSVLDFVHLHFGRISYSFSKNDGLVSVVIPTFNRCDILLDRALKSVLSQTYKNIEIIIVDDGSSDNTYETIKNLNNPKIKLFRNSRKKYRYPNKSIYHWFTGGVSAINLGLKKCRGQYIARIDDDDIWTEDHLEKLINFLKKHDYEFVYSHILAQMSLDEEKKVISNHPDPLGNTCTWLFLNYFKNFKMNIHCWRKMINRVFDTDVHNRIFKSGARVGYLEEVTAIYLPRPDEKFAGSKAYQENKNNIEKTYKI